jgi:glutamate--cysteine ligase
MSTREAGSQTATVTSVDELVGWIAAGEKPRDRWRIGTEHEKFPFRTCSLDPIPYGGPAGIRALMEGLIARYGWEPILEGETLIALRRPKVAGQSGPSATVSLEPGGQFELSGAPVANLHETNAETQEHLMQVLAVGERLGIGFLGVGFTPTWRLDDVPRMPKRRYGLMTRYMPQVGSRGLDMMYRTATIQVNLDFASEADMVAKLRVSLALQPVATALFASSPFTEGRPNGFTSMRSEVWRDTDTARTGMLPFVFEPGMGYARYVDYALDVPMYFVYRSGDYIDATGGSFRDFLAGRLPQMPGEHPTLDDWSDHLTTLFPEVRLKRFLEMRGADSGGGARIPALSAFWVGLLYDEAALRAASDLIAGWTAAERQSLRDRVPAGGLSTPLEIGCRPGQTMRDLAREVLAISQAGLSARAIRRADGADESVYLAPLADVVRDGRSLADDLLAAYHGRWQGRVEPIFVEYGF